MMSDFARIGVNYTKAGFRNLTASTSSYVYDNNGNLLTDPYKGLSINYNNLNRTDKITITTATGSYINYTYDANGSILRKQQYISGSVTATTDYIDGFVFVNSSLQYFPMPEGRVVNNGSALVQEFVITDQQGNARISFQDNGHGMAVVKQENSYYAFGLIMANSPVGPPVIPNKRLYNGGSEWQNNYANNLPDYYETFYRNYDAALGRWVGVDPKAEGAESLTVYQYSGNNPVTYNDPSGDLAEIGSEGIWHQHTGNWIQDFNDWQQNSMAGGGGFSPHFLSYLTDQITDYLSNSTGDVNIDLNRSALLTLNRNWQNNNEDGTQHTLAVHDLFFQESFAPGQLSGGYYSKDAHGNAAIINGVSGNYFTEGVNIVAEKVGANAGGTQFHGASVTFTDWLSPGNAYTLPGMGDIHINPIDIDDIDLLRHEFGHTLQARRYGYYIFYTTIATASIRSAHRQDTDPNYNHNEFMTEVDANNLSFLYFGMPSDWNFDRFPVSDSLRNWPVGVAKPSWQNWFFDWDNWNYPTVHPIKP